MSEHDPSETTPTEGRRGIRRVLPHRNMGRKSAVALGTGILVLGIAPLGYAATGGELKLGGRNSADKETEIVSKIEGTNALKGGYATRQSNTSSTGGGAIYGCRSTVKTSATDAKEPCVRANNLSSGLAFEFQATNGILGGTFLVGKGGDGTKPFTTNATGVADGLNADRVDGKDAQAIIDEAVKSAVADATAKANAAKSRWVLVNAEGQIEAQSGGFTIRSTYGGSPAGASENVYIDAGEDLTDNGISATLALQNQTDQNGDGVMNGKATGADANPEFSGEISATRCAIPGVVACAPTGANTNTHFVVSPRLSDGSPTSSTTRKRFYVTITG